MKLKDVFNDVFLYKWNAIINNDEIISELIESNMRNEDIYLNSAIMYPVTSIPFYKFTEFEKTTDEFPIETLDAVDITINQIILMKSRTLK